MDEIYRYSGAVMLFDKCIANNYNAETTASSIKKARANIMYRYKKENGLAPYAKIVLPGKFSIITDKEE